MDTSQIFSGFLQGLGIIAVAALLHESALRHCPSRRCRLVATTAVFTAGTVGSMVLPIELAPGLIFDLRHVFLVLAASYGGWVTALVVALSAIAYRLSEGGAGAVPGSVGIVISTVIGLGFAYFVPREKMSARKIVTLAVASNVSILSVFMLPWATAVAVLQKIGAPIVIANFIGVIAAAQILKRHHSQVALEKDLTKKAEIDALTGLANRYVFDQQASDRADSAIRAGKPCVVMLIDIDRFKSVNDTFGHVAGDQILRSVASVIARSARAQDLVARYGGEEIALVLPGCDLTNAQLIADRIRAGVEATRTEVRGLPLAVTVSIGFSVMAGVDDSFLAALQAADEALYSAKAGGRNRVVPAIAA
ncbi:MAG: diguanylate cyclase [Rhizobiaceae bacterium]